MGSDLLEKGYEPHDVERRWYEFWETNGLFAAEDQGPRRGYAIVIPPPNVRVSCTWGMPSTTPCRTSSAATGA